jgi:transcription-repair coupling factor (superfamily II helicase)
LFAVELSEKAKLIVQDCVIETDLEILMPESYVNNTSERLQLYARLDNIKDEDQLKKFSTELVDRFGEMPAPVQELVNSVRLRWLGEELGFEKISLKNDRLRGYFVSNNDAYFNSSVFGQILQFVQSHPRQCKMRDQSGKAMLVIEDVKSVDSGIALLNQMIGRMSKSASEIPSR